MQQTFNDLYNERKHEGKHALFAFVLWMFAETGVGIVREHALLVTGENAMKNILSNPTTVAITGLVLALPLGLNLRPLLNKQESSVCSTWWLVPPSYY